MGGSDHIHVDHQGLDQMRSISGRQAGYLAKGLSYINANCAKTEAFGGVLEPFKGTYETVVTNANNGMNDAQTFSGKMSNALHEAHQTYINTDNGEKERWDTQTQRAEGLSSTKLPTFLYKHGSKPVDDVLGLEDKGAKDPLTAGQDALKKKIRHALGQDTSKSTSEKVDKEAEKRNKQAITDRGKQAKQDARDAGATKKQASKAGTASRKADREDVKNRRNLLTNTVNPVKETVNQGVEMYDHVDSLVKDGKQTVETVKDIGDYDDYESRGNDATTKLENELG